MKLHERFVDFELTDIDLKKRQIVGTITTNAVDRYKEVVEPAGIDLVNYRKNPVVLLNHGRTYDLPIGRNLWIKTAKKGLTASTEMDTGLVASDVLRLYDAGIMKAWSIGFIGRKWEDADLAKSGFWRRWLESELVEYSAVTVPANPDAISNALDTCESPVLRDWLERERALQDRERRIEALVTRQDELERIVRELEEKVGGIDLVDVVTERILKAPVEELPEAPCPHETEAPVKKNVHRLEMSGIDRTAISETVRSAVLETLGRS